MNPDKTAPKESVIWVHIVCNIGYLGTYKEESLCEKLFCLFDWI